jgi:acylphosphatase
MAERCLKIRVSGRVQGVSFRAASRQAAEPLGITGYARNLSDGSVEVLACGDEDALERFVRWLHEGPRLAKVSDVQVEECDPIEAREFRTE